MSDTVPNNQSQHFNDMGKRLCAVVLFGIAFAYIEAAVVVYLRAIFHPKGFVFPLTEFGSGLLWQRFLLLEIGREAATIVLMVSTAWLLAKNRLLRVAYFLTIFAVWDIFYYLWLKIMLNWPSSIMDWDILFLIPITWASPVLAPVMVSMAMMGFAGIIFYRTCYSVPAKLTFGECTTLMFSALAMIISFCIAGLHITDADYRSHFPRPLFVSGYALMLILLVKFALKKQAPRADGNKKN